MATCKNCVHYEACQEMYDLLTCLEDIDFLDNLYAKRGCLLFKNKTDFQQVKHGEWLPDYETFVDSIGYESEPIQTGWVCSVCGRQEYRKEPYCHCGALMSNYEDEKKGEDNVRV